MTEGRPDPRLVAAWAPVVGQFMDSMEAAVERETAHATAPLLARIEALEHRVAVLEGAQGEAVQGGEANDIGDKQ